MAKGVNNWGIPVAVAVGAVTFGGLYAAMTFIPGGNARTELEEGSPDPEGDESARPDDDGLMSAAADGARGRRPAAAGPRGRGRGRGLTAGRSLQ